MKDKENRPDPGELLEAFVASGRSEEAFAALVEALSRLVYSSALRRVDKPQLAEEITQNVFALLARKAESLQHHPALQAWIFETTRLQAPSAMRAERRRQRKIAALTNEATAQDSGAPNQMNNPATWKEALPLLDEALDRLPVKERNIILQRFYEGKKFREIAATNRETEGACKKRMKRALEKLTRMLTARGVTLSTTVMASALGTELARSAPVQSAAALAPQALAATSSLSTTAVVANTLQTISPLTTVSTLTIIMKTKAILISAIIIAILGTTVYVANQRDGGSAQDPPSTGGSLQPATRSPRREAGPTTAPENDPLFRITSEEEFYAVVESVLLIADDAERLEAIRSRLGMDIPDEVYRDAIAAVGFDVDPQRLFERLLMAWGLEDPKPANLWVRRTPGEFAEEASRKMLAAWLVMDEAAALAWAEQNLDPGALESAREFTNLMRVQLVENPSAQAAELLGGLHQQLLAISGSDVKSSSAKAELVGRIDGVLLQWARRDPLAAAEFATTLDQDIRQQLSHMSFLIAEWAKKDPDNALAWVKGLEDEKERAAALVSALPGWQLKHPDQSLDEAADLSIIPDDRFRMLIRQVVGDLAMADPSHAMEYSLSLEDPGDQRAMVGITVESWARKAPAQARQAVEALPAGALRDTGLSRLSPQIARTSFDDARGLVREIEDAAIRQETIETMLIFGNAFERHFPQALQFADELPQVDHMAVHGWTNKITPENVPAFRTWLEEAKAAGKIKFPTHPNPEDADPEQVRRHNETAAAVAYGIILEALEKAPERK